MRLSGRLNGMPVYLNPHLLRDGYCVVTIVPGKQPGDEEYHVVAVGPGGVSETRHSMREVKLLAHIEEDKDKT